MSKMTEQEADRLMNEWVIEYLERSPAEERHKIVSEWNYDGSFDAGGRAPLFDFLADSPDTDAATILKLYWMLGPRWLKQFAAEEDADAYYDRPAWRLLHRLEERYLGGFYPQQNLAWNPASDEDGHDWTAEYADKPQHCEIPPAMYRALAGRAVPRPDDWVEGIPPALQPRVNELLEQLD